MQTIKEKENTRHKKQRQAGVAQAESCHCLLLVGGQARTRGASWGVVHEARGFCSPRRVQVAVMVAVAAWVAASALLISRCVHRM